MVAATQRTRRWITGLALILGPSLGLGCSSATTDADYGGGPAGDGEAEDEDPWGEQTAGGESGGGDGGDDGGATTGDEPQGDDGSGGPAEPPPPPTGRDDGTFAGCPQPLPASWVFCEDFETITDPSEVALDYQDVDGAFTLIDELGASGSHSMEVRYREGEEAAGWMVVSFGSSPIDTADRPSHAPDASFQEIYWRLRIKTEPGWPDIGPGSLTRAIAFADADWSEATVARLGSADADVVLSGTPSTCVVGSEVACTGFEDQDGLRQLEPLVGDTPLFSEEESGSWHCVEGHLLLNNPGVADGVFEFWVDDVLQASRDDLDLRGAWTDYGLNAVVVENLWPGGATQPLRRWIDDVVISSEPVGCVPGPAGTQPE